MRKNIYTAEFVFPGHPDKLSDAIADALVQEASRRQKRALVGVEVAVHRNSVFVTGRIGCEGAEEIDVSGIVRDVYRSAGYGGDWAPDPGVWKSAPTFASAPWKMVRQSSGHCPTTRAFALATRRRRRKPTTFLSNTGLQTGSGGALPAFEPRHRTSTWARMEKSSSLSGRRMTDTTSKSSVVRCSRNQHLMIFLYTGQSGLPWKMK